MGRDDDLVGAERPEGVVHRLHRRRRRLAARLDARRREAASDSPSLRSAWARAPSSSEAQWRSGELSAGQTTSTSAPRPARRTTSPLSARPATVSLATTIRLRSPPTRERTGSAGAGLSAFQSPTPIARDDEDGEGDPPAGEDAGHGNGGEERDAHQDEAERLSSTGMGCA